MSRLKHICIYSNSPHENAGYSLQARYLTKFLKNSGYEVSIFANSGISGQALRWKDIDVYPVRGNPYDLNMVRAYADFCKADVVITLYDLFVLPDDARKQLGRPWIAWVPIDGEPVPSKVQRVVKGADWVLAMSKFGQDQLAKVGIESEYMPLGIDCDVYCPGDRAAAREEFDFPPDAFVVGTVAMNKGWPCRKSFPELMDAFGRFHDKFPRNTLLYMHTTQTPYGTRAGANIPGLMGRTGIPRDAVRITSEADIGIGVPEETMAQLYRAMDVLLSPSMGEGFSLAPIEAQACGTPVITQDCTAMTEHTWYGQAIKPLQRFYVPQLDYWWNLASVPRIVDALTAVYRSPRDERAAKVGVHKVRQSYHWPDLFERKWQVFLQKVEAQLW